jgi:hypothetical protein
MPRTTVEAIGVHPDIVESRGSGGESLEGSPSLASATEFDAGGNEF